MRILKNDLTHYFIRPHDQLPRSYLASCKKFFKDLSNKQQAASVKLQATSVKRCNLFTTMLEKKTERENEK